MIHEFPLLRIGQQFRHCVIAHGHVVEVPDKPSTPLNHLINKFIGADRIQILAGVAAGQAEGQMLLLQDCHCLNHFLVGTVAPAAIGGRLKALHADGRDKILHPEHLVCKSFVDQCGVGEGKELAVAVLFTQGDQVLFANQRLTAGIYVHIYAHFLALGDNGIDLVKGQVQLVAVFRGPAAGAVQVAGRGRVKQNGPRNIAVIFLPVFLLLWPTDDIRVEEEIFKGGL